MTKVYSPSPWTNGLTITTIIGVVIIIGVIVYVSYLYPSYGKHLIFAIPSIVSICLLLVTLLVTMILMPRGVSKSEKGITVHLLAKNIEIPVDEIESVEIYPNKGKTIRVFGSGGMFGYIGMFNNDNVGEFVCFATDWSRSYIIKRKNKRPIVVTVENPSVLSQ